MNAIYLTVLEILAWIVGPIAVFGSIELLQNRSSALNEIETGEVRGEHTQRRMRFLSTEIKKTKFLFLSIPISILAGLFLIYRQIAVHPSVTINVIKGLVLAFLAVRTLVLFSDVYWALRTPWTDDTELAKDYQRQREQAQSSFSSALLALLLTSAFCWWAFFSAQ